MPKKSTPPRAGKVKPPERQERWVDTDASAKLLTGFFRTHGVDIKDFGQTVNQTFEAFVFSSVIRWYIRHDWSVSIINPANAPDLVRLKFNTRGRPSGYTYALAEKDGESIQIRHQLRVATYYHQLVEFEGVTANICADVAIIKDHDISNFKSDDFIRNENLISFGEAKHMPAFAELVANFVGLVHELKPASLTPGQRPYVGPLVRPQHLSPFLYVSGHIQRTAQGVIATIKFRGFDIEIFDYRSDDLFGNPIPLRPAPPKPPVSK